jgi:hypothetical protein
MNEDDVRKLTEEEILLVEALLRQDVAGAAQLRAQLPDCTVFPINCDETILRFSVSPQVPQVNVPYIQNVAVEASAKDIDGCRVEVLLHVKEGRIYELEYIKTDGTPLKRRPLAEDLFDLKYDW